MLLAVSKQRLEMGLTERDKFEELTPMCTLRPMARVCLKKLILYWENIEQIGFYWETIGKSSVIHWQSVDIERRLREYWEVIEGMLIFLNIWPRMIQGKEHQQKMCGNYICI